MILEKLFNTNRKRGKTEMKKEEVDELKKKIHEANEAYMNGVEIIDDPTYDSLVEKLVDLEGEQARPYSRTKQSDNINDIVGTITKVFGVTAPFVPDHKYYVNDFIQKHNLTHDTLVAIQYKLDGCSVAFDYDTERFFTRGDYANGESSDVTPLFEKCLPQMYELNKRYNNELRTAKFEFICSREVYNAHFTDEYKRPRDVAAAHLKVVSDQEKMNKNIKVCTELCDLIPLRVIDKSNHTYVCEDIINDIIPATDYTRIESFIDILGKNEFCMHKRPFNTSGFSDTTVFTYECDGVVVTSIDNSERIGAAFYDDICGDPDTFVQDTGYECAIKILNMLKQTKIKNVKFSYGKTGRITPVAILEPVQFDNVTVDHVTLSNLSRIYEDNLKYNDTVDIMYNIIPYFVRSLHDGDDPIELPTTCPICGFPLDISEGYRSAYCINKFCIGKNLGNITRYAESIGIFGLKESTISKLMEAHLVTTIPDLYRLTTSDISTLDTFGDKSAQNIIDNISASKQHLTFPRFLSGFQFRYISQKTWMQVCTELNLTPEFLMDASLNQLVELIMKSSIKNIGSQTKRFLIEGFTDNLDLIKETMGYIPSFEPFKTISDYKGIITMTGTHDKTFIKDVTDAGYIVRDWSNKTDILVIPSEDYTSNKVTAALKRAIPIYTLSQAREKLL